jgi:hypothetical protein
MPRINVIEQGAPLVNEGTFHRRGKSVVALEIDLHSKYCQVMATYSADGAPGVIIGATKRSLHLLKGMPRRKETTIEFPNFVGWYIWCASIGRYSLSVCLVKANA